MPSISDINEIFANITQEFADPVSIGARCESRVYYQVEDLSDEDLNTCAQYVAERIINICHPHLPDFILKLPGGYTFFAERLSAVFSELTPGRIEIPVEQYLESKLSNGFTDKWRGMQAVLVTDVITTARSSLEAHTKATLKGIQIPCWASLIDRTFGPGPVPVVSAFTGEPVRVLTKIG